MTWKEPRRVRELRFKRFPSLFLGVFLQSVIFVLISMGLMVATNAVTVTIHEVIQTFLFLGWCIPFFLMMMASFPLLLNFLEATYYVDEEGIYIQRARIVRTMPWRTVTHLEIIPHSTLENISLIRVTTSSRQIMFDPIPSKTPQSPPPQFWAGTKHHEEFPFATGELDTEAIIELFQKYGRKKKGLWGAILGNFTRQEPKE